VKTYALVTGASRGLGKAIAEALAQQNKNLLLIALPGEHLPDLCRQLSQTYQIDCKGFETDLTDSGAVYQIAEWALSEGRIDILINNAGMGGTRLFEDASPEYIHAIIQINIRTVALLSRLLLDELKSHPRAYILNVASMASFTPLAFKTVYPASKAFVSSFSRSLSEELKDTGIHVCVVYPGPMKTNPDVVERILKQGWRARIGMVSVERTAQLALKNLFNNDSYIIPGNFNKISRWLLKIIPDSIVIPMVSHNVKKEINHRTY
jgi:short-subunit dehydrogenase